MSSPPTIHIVGNKHSLNVRKTSSRKDVARNIVNEDDDDDDEEEEEEE